MYINRIAEALATTLGWHKPKAHYPKQTKECLECGRAHTHNNSWCSPQCCKLWRAKKKYSQ